MRFLIFLVLFFSVFSSLGVTAEIERFDVPLGTSPQLGPQSAPITMVEFLDFQ